MYTVKPTMRFSKDLKRIEKRGYKIDLLTFVFNQNRHTQRFLLGDDMKVRLTLQENSVTCVMNAS